MIYGILEIEGVPFLRRLLNYRLGTGVLGIEAGGNSRLIKKLAASGERRPGGCEAALNFYVSWPRSLAIQSFMYGGQ